MIRNMLRFFILTLALAFAVFRVATAGETRRIEILVTEKGFEPTPVSVKKGQPVTLVVTRKTDKTCARKIVFDEPKITEALPLNKPVEITFTPTKTGDLKYGCAMGKMISGVIRVE